MISVVCLRYYPAVGGVETTVLEITNRLAKSFPMKVITSDLKVENPFQRLSEKERLSEYMNVPIIRLESKKFLPVEGYGVIMKGVNEAHRILLVTLGNKDQEKSSSRPIQNLKERQLVDFLLNPES